MRLTARDGQLSAASGPPGTGEVLQLSCPGPGAGTRKRQATAQGEAVEMGGREARRPEGRWTGRSR